MTDFADMGSKNEYSRMSLEELQTAFLVLGQQVASAHEQLNLDDQFSCANVYTSWAERMASLSLLIEENKLSDARAEMIAFEKISKDLITITESLRSSSRKVVNIKKWKDN